MMVESMKLLFVITAELMNEKNNTNLIIGCNK